jgi:hypothetical protein
MPKRRRVWSSWNYLAQRGADTSKVSVSYWMNCLQGIDLRVPLFVSLNPLRDPAAHKVHASIDYEHPVYDLAAFKAQQQLQRLQGVRGTWFCGSYFGAGFHEDALTSGLAAAEAAGGLSRPWAKSGVTTVQTPPIRWAAE